MITITFEPHIEDYIDHGTVNRGFRDSIIYRSAQMMNRMYQDTFRNQRGIDGKDWATDDISEETKKRKNSSKIMIDTGNMSRFLWRFLKISQGYEIGTDAWYAGFHNWGTHVFPARNFIGINDRVIREIQEVTVDTIESGV